MRSHDAGTSCSHKIMCSSHKGTSHPDNILRKNPFCMSFKGHCHEHRFKNSRFQKHILQQRKPTNTGPVLIKITMPVL